MIKGDTVKNNGRLKKLTPGAQLEYFKLTCKMINKDLSVCGFMHNTMLRPQNTLTAVHES